MRPPQSTISSLRTIDIQNAVSIDSGTKSPKYVKNAFGFLKSFLKIFDVDINLNSIKLGYISRFKNKTITRLMDVGKKFIAVVDDFSDYTEEELARNPFSPIENMSLPFSVYLIEDE